MRRTSFSTANNKPNGDEQEKRRTPCVRRFSLPFLRLVYLESRVGRSRLVQDRLSGRRILDQSRTVLLAEEQLHHLAVRLRGGICRIRRRILPRLTQQGLREGGRDADLLDFRRGGGQALAFAVLGLFFAMGIRA